MAAKLWSWQKKNNGFYVLCEFTSSGDIVGRLERHFQLDENIIRFLILALDKKALQARISASDLMKQLAPAAATTGSPLVALTDDIAKVPETPTQNNV
jgi:hypothetical protein